VQEASQPEKEVQEASQPEKEVQEASQPEKEVQEAPMVPVVIEKAPLFASSTPSSKPYGKVITKREPLRAAILSFIVPGLGQVYNEHLKKGIALALLFYALIVAIISSIFALVIMGSSIWAFCCTPVFIFPAIVLLYAVYDAYKTASKSNEWGETADRF